MRMNPADQCILKHLLSVCLIHRYLRSHSHEGPDLVYSAGLLRRGERINDEASERLMV